MKKALLGALVFSVMTAVQASAVTIDFASSAWAGAHNDESYTMDSVTAIAQGEDAELRYSGSWGLGINSDDDNSPNEVEQYESIRLNFASAFNLTSFVVGRLGTTEIGYYRLNGSGAWTQFGGAGSNGFTTINLTTTVTSIQFGYPWTYDGGSEFYLKSITGDFGSQSPSAVPEPTSMVLLGTGLLGLAARARRKKQA